MLVRMMHALPGFSSVTKNGKASRTELRSNKENTPGIGVIAAEKKNFPTHQGLEHRSCS